MSTKWTADQQKVIDERNKDILVSAAAGSGKTAVLVERIIGLITSKTNPIDVDQLLVVTFTKAAAAEMKERILKAIEDEFKKNPLNEHLEKQLTYVQNAHITTIDSFCLSVVKNNFNVIGIDPSFRIGDNDELELLKNDVLSELIEEYYETENEEFLTFIDEYVSKQGKSDVDKSILKLFNISTSYPYPIKWLNSLIDNYKDMDIDKLKETEWFLILLCDVKDKVSDIVNIYKDMIEICMDIGGPKEYLDTIEREYVNFSNILEKEDFIELCQAFEKCTFDRLHSVSKNSKVDESLKKQVTENRNKIKKVCGSISQLLNAASLEDEAKVINNLYPNVSMLIKLVIDFSEKFIERKKEKNLVDFSDVLHYALDILTEVENDKVIPTKIAKEMSEEFYEIMIDEYQDSNYVQEAILNSVSKKHKGINNIFMVGDVKQSIYRFRQARPDLFVEKYNLFKENGDSQTKICLSKNFRSRKQVLDICNLVFSQLMTKSLGGIEYDDAASLHYGADYKEHDTQTELLIINHKTEKGISEDFDESEDDISKEELEAHAIANKIIDMVKGKNPYMVQDKKTKEMRPVQYGDIAILARSGKKIGETISRVLEDSGIPAECENTTGYFDTFEINTILNYLRIIDNVRQDIPLVSVLRNVYGFTENELAIIKGNKGKEICYYDTLKMFIEETYFDKTLVLKVQAFLEDINKYRECVPYTPIYQLINMIINETGFIDFITAMEGGKKKVSNIEMLLEKALIYENTSFNGLFDFARYIEKIKKYDIETGESSVSDNSTDAVKIMTIHKSKGLEFPVVFLAATGRKFNDMDSKEKIVVNDRIGFGMDYTDNKRGMKYKSLIKKSVNLMNVAEDKAEELRVLYVAMTRAKEKLIITATVDIESKLKSIYEKSYHDKVAFNRNQILSANSYFDWIVMALIRHKSMSGLLAEFDLAARFNSPVFDNEAKISIICIDEKNIVYNRIQREIIDRNTKEALINFDENKIYDENQKKVLDERMKFIYNYCDDLKLKAKVSVSEIKHANMKNSFEEYQEDIVYMPEFLKETIENRGALRGTAYHRVFELFDYSMDVESVDDIRTMFLKMVESKKISQDMIELVDAKKIFLFSKSNLGVRMKKAYFNNSLMREKAFVMGIDPKILYKDIKSEEPVLVQGIIDALFIEDDEIVVVDYKTDSVERIENLKERYRAQLQLYGNAVEASFGKKVKELIIYSTKFQDELIIHQTKGCVEQEGE